MITQTTSKYEQVIPPYDHQKREFEEHGADKIRALFWEMGSGKTKTILDTAQHLYLSGEIDGVLIIAPKGCYMNYKDNEIPKNLSPKIVHRVAHWSAVLRKGE